MLTIDKIFHASLVLKDIIRPTPLARAYGFSKDFTLYSNAVVFPPSEWKRGILRMTTDKRRKWNTPADMLSIGTR